MYINTHEDDQISLTLKEFAILTALADRPASAYTIAGICAEDANTARGSYGSLHVAIQRLARVSLIKRIETHGYRNPGKPRIVYQLTATGQLILKWHCDRLEHLTALARRRLSAALPGQ